MQTAITLTTIYKPLVIEEYLKNIIKYNHKDTEIIVVEDKKTPSDVKEFCEGLEKKYNIPIRYLDLKFQKDYLIKYIDSIIPALFRANVKKGGMLTSMWKVIRLYHPYAVVLSAESTESNDSKVLKGLYLLTIQAMLMFIMALFCDFQVL